MNILHEFGQKIKELRKAKGWSQEKLAEESGFHRTYIGRVERGERNLSLTNINKFAKAFNVPLNHLFI